jgi:putative ABC transport system permease protein
MTKIPRPAHLAIRLLERFSGWEDDYGAAGDFEEYFHVLVKERGARRARQACWRQVLAMLPGYLANTLRWSITMLKNYLRIAFRNIRKNKGYSAINIAGLTVGIACALFILLWVQDELSFDRFHANAKTLYRVEQEQQGGQGSFHVYVTPYPMGPVLKAEIPEIKEAARVAYPGDLLIRYGENAFFERRVWAADPSIFQMFTFPLTNGDPATALAGPGSLVISEDMARKYFGEADPMGKSITINNSHAFTITGVMKNVPANSTLRFDMLVPFDFVKTLGQYNDSMDNNNILTFVQLHPQSEVGATGEKITRVVRSRVIAQVQADPGQMKLIQTDPEARRRFESYRGPTFMLMPLVDIKLYGYFGFSRNDVAIKYVYTFASIALFVLLIACINFMNLATARSANRAKEVGLRKVVGAFRKSIIGQFYGESIVTAFLAGAASLVLVALLFPGFKALAAKPMMLGTLLSGKFIVGILAVTLFTGIVAGCYPALYLSSFQPVRSLKGGPGKGSKSALFRKVLVVLQFSLSILLLIGMGVVSRQIEFMRNKKLGYDKDQLIYLPMRGDTYKSYAAFKEQLLRNPRVLGVTATHQEPTDIGSNGWGAEWDGKDPSRRVLVGWGLVDFDFTETMKIELAAGRPFSRKYATDNGKAFLVNEEVPKLMGLDPASAVGKRFNYGVEGTIVGVMKNFHYQSVRNAIEPMAVIVDSTQFRFAIIRLSAGEIPTSLEAVKTVWTRVFPQYPVEYRFFDEDFGEMYRADERMGLLLKVFAGVAVFIACLGLLGLASFMAERRTREIGIRKVLGATPQGIVLLLSKEFAKWVLAANLIAWPVAYFMMKNWLQGFAYRSPIVWWLFAASGAGALAVALLAVSSQAFRASRVDPARSLKYE